MPTNNSSQAQDDTKACEYVEFAATAAHCMRFGLMRQLVNRKTRGERSETYRSATSAGAGPLLRVIVLLLLHVEILDHAELALEVAVAATDRWLA